MKVYNVIAGDAILVGGPFASRRAAKDWLKLGNIDSKAILKRLYGRVRVVPSTNKGMRT